MAIFPISGRFCRLGVYLIWALLGLGLFYAISAVAVEKLTLHISQLAQAGWKAEQIVLNLQFQTANQGLARLRIARLLLPPPLENLRQVEIRCERIELVSANLQCQEGVATFLNERFVARSSPFKFSYHLVTQALSFELKALALLGGDGIVSGHFEKTSWQMQFSGQSLSLVQVLPYLTLWDSWPWIRPLKLSLEGSSSLEAKLEGQGKLLRTINLSAQFNEVSFSDPKTLHVGEAVAGNFQFQGQKTKRGWHISTELILNGGEVYLDPVYLGFSETPLYAELELGQGGAGKGWSIPQFKLQQTGVVHATGSLEFAQQRVTKAQVQVEPARLPALYQYWLEPFLVKSALGGLKSSGDFALTLNYAFPKQWRLRVLLQEVNIVDRQGRFSVTGLEGQLGWSTCRKSLMTDLRWEGGQIYALNLGGARLIAESKEGGFRLHPPLELPVLDGHLLIDNFVLKNTGTPSVSWALEGVLSPISMERFSRSLGWPVLAGKLSGVIPRVSYREGVIEVGGALLVRAFDGAIVARNLRLENPLGVVPQLTADIDMSNLDLEILTRTFAFGKIEGRLSGQMRELHLANWRPVKFEAEFATPGDDPSWHRISQQAIDSLSRLGGGATGFVSRGFLGLFEDFYYDKIGLTCRLRRQICEMGGLGPANDGYYIVRGSGLPRIDVIGHTHQVDWPVLVKRLKRVISARGLDREARIQ